MTILEALTHSPQNKKALAHRLGTDSRSVEAAVQEARLAGAPVLSSSAGYWLSQDPSEIRACADRLRSRALTQLETSSALKKAADELPLAMPWAGGA